MKIELDSRFDQPLNRFLIVAIEGDPETIRQKICELAFTMLTDKPRQGTFISSDDTTQIITPVWNGRRY